MTNAPMSVLQLALAPVAMTVIGASVAAFRPPSPAIRSAIQHFAAGVVFSVIAVELLPDVTRVHDPLEIGLSFAAGVAMMLLLERFALRLEKGDGDAAKERDGNVDAGQLIAIGIDILIDGLLIGIAAAARTLPAETQAEALAYLHAERFRDAAPAQVHATLLDDGIYVCSVRTMYRLLDAQAKVRERRALATRAPCAIPRVVARTPNHVWTWDVTDLKGPVKGDRYPLYVVLDLFSRYVVA